MEPGITTRTAVDQYLTWAATYYRKPSGRPTGEHLNMKDALKALTAVTSGGGESGGRLLSTLRAEDLYAAQEWMIQQGYVRSVINARMNRIRRFVRWTAKPPRRWVPATLLAELDLVEPLKRGRSTAAESEEVTPVDWDRVNATMAVVDLETALMLELLWYTGMRPGECCQMTRSSLTSSADGATIYKPLEHKTEHYGQLREVEIGPKGQQLLDNWLRHHLPRDQDRLWRHTTASLYNTIRYWNRKRGVLHWHPNQIRHSFATEMEKKVGWITTQYLLGHASPDTTGIYVARHRSEMHEAMKRFG